MTMERRVALEVDPRQQAALERLLREFPKQADRAIARAVDRAGAKVKTLTLRAVTRALTIKRKHLTQRHYFGVEGGRKAAVVLEKMHRGRNRLAVVRISGRRIPVVWFKAKAVYRTPRGRLSTKQLRWRKGWFAVQRPAGIRWKINRDGAWKHGERAFFAAGRRGQNPGGGGNVATLGKSGHVGVFVRWPPSVKRLPISELHGPSIAQEAKRNAELAAALTDQGPVRETLTRRLEHELERLLDKAGGPAASSPSPSPSRGAA